MRMFLEQFHIGTQFLLEAKFVLQYLKVYFMLMKQIEIKWKYKDYFAL